jgi:hypothetical protein
MPVGDAAILPARSPEGAVAGAAGARPGSAGLADSRGWILSRVPAGSTVLLVGEAPEALVRALRGQDCTVDAVNLLSHTARRARRWCRRTSTASLAGGAFAERNAGRYDRVVIAASEAERLPPARAGLEAAIGLLAKGGSILLSMPNTESWRPGWERVQQLLQRGRREEEPGGEKAPDVARAAGFSCQAAAALFASTRLSVRADDYTTRMTLSPAAARRLAEPLLRALPAMFACEGYFELVPARILVPGAPSREPRSRMTSLPPWR